MKIIFWLLAMINLGLIAYFNMDLILPNAPQNKALEIHPEKIKLLTQDEINALPRKKVEQTASTPAPICYEWGMFADNMLENAQKSLAPLSLNAQVKEQNSNQPKRFWVYKPPLKSLAEAQQKAAEIKAKGVDDLFVVQEAQWKNAISFGIFEDEQLATNLLKELQAKGIKNVQKTVRTQGKAHASLLLSNLTETHIAEIKKFKPDFPEAELKQVSCAP
ncbi:MAG: SPOR domain-containing protein [Methylotenera sp.]|nr:SPOR domain-containing protein [Methylotenera sp.]